MAMQTKRNHSKESITKEIQDRRGILERAKVQLKQEFFGIDGVIDEVVEAISSWYLFPDIQEKPVIVNLWGMTGVGKTSLISRLSELIGFSKRTFWFDLGETSEQDWATRRILNGIFENENGYPVILCFDEFQHSRTRGPTGEEIARPDLRIIWSLLSEGTFQMSRYYMSLEELYLLYDELSEMLKLGVMAENGILTSGVEKYQELMDHHNGISQKSRSLKRKISGGDPGQQKRANKIKDIPFIPTDSFEEVFEVAREKYKTRTELKKHLMTLDGPGTLDFLNDLFETACSRRIVDCTKAIMFVVGNLDEAYTMNLNLNPDIDADAFYQGSLKITIPHVKKALRKLFRSEQIARLGNTHILYPALSRSAYQQIIYKALGKLKTKIINRFGMQLIFEESIRQLIYDEAVYPTQGARPLFTTIHFLIEAKLGKIIGEALLMKRSVYSIRLERFESSLRISYLQSDGTLIQKTQEELKLSLETIRKPKQDDNQAITAVHESGHAILSAILLHAIPEVVVSVSADSGSTGFTHVKVVREYQSKKELIPTLASHFGGYIAEKLIFGEEHITVGSEKDISEATELACECVKASGLGSIRGSIQVAEVSTNDQLHLDVTKEITELLEAGEKLAEETIHQEELLLIRMADYLSDHRSMDNVLIEEYISRYAINKSMLSIRGSYPLAYRKVLKTQARQIKGSRSKPTRIPIENISLNKTNP